MRQKTTSLPVLALPSLRSNAMQSESARLTTRNESRFRVDYPNSIARSVKVIALDETGRRLVDKIALLPWARATFFTSLSHEQSPVRAESNAVRAWLNDIAGQTKSLIEEIETADVVVMIVGAGSTADAAPLIGEACQLRNVTAVGLVLQDEETTDEAIERTLRKMRQFVTMLVVASGDEYAEAMLTALRA
jgi:hypothetical protein